MKITVATCRLFPDPSASNAVLIDAIRARGVEVDHAMWNGGDGRAFVDADLTLLRQTWDYVLDPGGYAAWAARIARRGARLSNAAHLAIWNNDKRTLTELREAGVRIPETVPVALDDPDDVLDAISTDRVVLKPSFGGGGHGVTSSNKADWRSALRAAADAHAGASWMAQAFLPEIAMGELSLTCLRGDVAFAVRRTPAAGEFRVNNRFAPTIARVEPPDGAVDAARRVFTWLDAEPLFWRLDGVLRGDDFIATELELTDPDLHLDVVPEAADRMAAAAIAVCEAPAD